MFETPFPEFGGKPARVLAVVLEVKILNVEPGVIATGESVEMAVVVETVGRFEAAEVDEFFEVTVLVTVVVPEEFMVVIKK